MDYELVRNINAAAITRFHDAALCPATGGCEPRGGFEAVWQSIEQNHRSNALLWIEEEKARRGDIADAYVAACKRRIDRYNEQRTEALEAIDERLLEALGRLPRHNGARLHSETAGTMIDRLSILSLRIHHTRMQADLAAASNDGAGRLRAQLVSLVEQRVDLARCFDELIAGTTLGIVYFKIYRRPGVRTDPRAIHASPPGATDLPRKANVAATSHFPRA